MRTIKFCFDKKGHSNIYLNKAEEVALSAIYDTIKYLYQKNIRSYPISSFCGIIISKTDRKLKYYILHRMINTLCGIEPPQLRLVQAGRARIIYYTPQLKEQLKLEELEKLGESTIFDEVKNARDEYMKKRGWFKKEDDRPGQDTTPTRETL